jgi:integrase/recombinase XerD
MNNSTTSIIEEYLIYCKIQKRLNEKTLKAYRIDLTQFSVFFEDSNIRTLSVSDIESFIGYLNQNFKPKTAKRKLASLKALFHYLEYRNIIESNPFNKIRTKFREPLLLPKTIPLYTIEVLLAVIYRENSLANTVYRKKRTLLDTAIIETLFSTGMRISELCCLKNSDVDLYDASIRIYGKGSKERIIQIGNEDVIQLLKHYEKTFESEIEKSGYFFTNPNATPISDQSVRRMINKYCSLAAIDLHITPHMFRHTFATCLLEADVDIRYIQEMLGHSSITVTEIYTHVALSKQKDILTAKHPRKNFKFYPSSK